MSETVLREVVLPAAFDKNGNKFVDYELDKKYGAQDNFQSSVSFLTALVKSGNGLIKLPLVVKFQPKDEIVRKELKIGVQFYNEIFMYSNILPFINKNAIIQDTFPIFYHGVGTLIDSDADVIVIEDLRPKGFRLTDEKVFLDLPHLELALEKLGKFHALSYVAKSERSKEFTELVGELKEPSWVDDRPGWMDSTIRKCFHRAMDPLISSERHVAVLRRLLARLDEPGGVVRVMRELVIPEEPTAVLCHGDFCRNNMLFHYSDASTPDDIRFFDVATARYSSPFVDISFFLFMNSSAAQRSTHWDHLLTRYHTALLTTVKTLSHTTTVPTIQQLHQEMKLKAIYGFFHASFFLPMMLWGEPPQEMDGMDLDPEEVGKYNASLGGEEGTKLLTDMVEELVARGCLTLDHPFLKHPDV